MLRCHRIRYLAIHCKIVDSHAIQIHRSNAVIIGRITAGLAAEDMFLLVTVGLFRVTANRTGLTCITRVHVDYGTLVECSLAQIYFCLQHWGGIIDNHRKVYS